MKLRPLGNTQLQVSPICFGGNVFAWTADEQASFQLLDRFVQRGANFIDTADVYPKWAAGRTGGESESIIGRWMKARGNRDGIIIATKVGMEMGPDRKGLSSAYIKRAAEDSLRRLQTDYIDLYLAHIDDKETPLEETLRAFSELVAEGKVRAIGASNYTGARLREALALSGTGDLSSYGALQPHYNLYDRHGYEQDLEPVCRQHNIGVMTYFSLASGFLTGKYRSQPDTEGRERGSRVVGYLNERGLRILDALDSVAETHSVKPAAVALAWLMARPSVTSAIASATTLTQLDELLEAVELKLDGASQLHLDHASAY